MTNGRSRRRTTSRRRFARRTPSGSGGTTATAASIHTSAPPAQPTYAGQAGFASGLYDLDQRHTAQAFTLRTDRKKDWDFELVGSTYRFNYDQQRSPVSAASRRRRFNHTGRVAVLDGTGWETLDLKGTWKPGGQISRAHAELRRALRALRAQEHDVQHLRLADGGSRTACSPKATARRRRRRSGRRTRGTSRPTSSSPSAAATRIGAASMG